MRSILISTLQPLLCLFFLYDLTKEGKMSGTCSTHKKKFKTHRAYNILVGNFEVKGPLERPRHRWEDNIKMYVRKRYDGVDWIKLALLNAVMNLRVP
jgi:hypothetical protein